MSEASRTFSAWSVPAGLAAPGGLGAEFQAGGIRVRYPAAGAVWIRKVAEGLRGAGGALRARSAREVSALVGAVGARFLDPADPLRQRALDLLPATSALSPEMASAVLDGMASDWTAERLGRLLDAEFADPAALDGFVRGGSGRVRAVGPELCVQIVSGSVPGVAATALIRSLLVKGPTLIKPGRGDVVLPVLMAEALRDVDPVVGNAVAVVYWPGGTEPLEDAALLAGDVVAAYGADEVVRALRARTPLSTRFVAYHHRVSFGVVGREALDDRHRHRAASDVAGSVCFFDQRGCVSPQLVYVEEGGETSPLEFARELAVAMQALEQRLPGGGLDALEASRVHQIRGTAELLAAAGSGVEVHHGGPSSWTVIYDPAPSFELSCAGRVIRVKPVPDVLCVAALVAPFARHLQTAALAGCGGRVERLASDLADVGVSRITGFDATPFPPPWWHHDGQGSLHALVRWVDLEG